MTKKIQVNREEHEALCHLRDVVHERTKIELLAARENYKMALSVNADQLGRLNGQDLTLTHLREQLVAMQARAQAAEARVRELTPATLSANHEQPLFQKQRNQ